jgi:hypothetical protein
MRTFLLFPLAFFCLSLFTIACDDRAKVQILQKETEDLHDDAMKGMSVINRVARNFKKEVAALDSIGTTTALERKAALLTVIEQMEKAENDMMAWMAEYKAPDSLSTTEALKYLQDQYQKMQQNQADIKAAMHAAKSLAK